MERHHNYVAIDQLVLDWGHLSRRRFWLTLHGCGSVIIAPSSWWILQFFKGIPVKIHCAVILCLKSPVFNLWVYFKLKVGLILRPLDTKCAVGIDTRVAGSWNFNGLSTTSISPKSCSASPPSHDFVKCSTIVLLFNCAMQIVVYASRYI